MQIVNTVGVKFLRSARLFILSENLGLLWNDSVRLVIVEKSFVSNSRRRLSPDTSIIRLYDPEVTNRFSYQWNKSYIYVQCPSAYGQLLI